MKTKNYEIKFHETDCNNRLKESVLLNFLQDIAAEDAEIIGVGYSKIKDKNIGWFLSKYHIKIFETLKNDGKLSISTVSRGAIKLSCFRDFDIFNSKEEKIGEGTSSWILVDLETGRIIPATKIFDIFDAPDKNDLRSNFPKINPPENIDFQKEFTASFHDIDVNQHVNNAVYLTWADEVLPIELLKSTRISELEIQYKQQVKYGEKVIVSAQYDKENQIITEELKTENGETACLIKQKRVLE